MRWMDRFLGKSVNNTRITPLKEQSDGDVLVEENTNQQDQITAEEENIMAVTTSVDQALDELMKIKGAVGCALVDYTSGMSLGASGGAGLDLDLAAAGNSEVIRAKMKVMESLRLRTKIEDILITLGDQYHLIRLLSKQKSLFIYLVLRREDANLAIARHKLTEVEDGVTL